MKIRLDFAHRHCECCGRTHMTKTIQLSGDEFGTINLGVICASHWFSVNLTGNIYAALRRLQWKIDKTSEKDILGVIERARNAGNKK